MTRKKSGTINSQYTRKIQYFFSHRFDWVRPRGDVGCSCMIWSIGGDSKKTRCPHDVAKIRSGWNFTLTSPGIPETDLKHKQRGDACFCPHVDLGPHVVACSQTYVPPMYQKHVCVCVCVCVCV